MMIKDEGRGEERKRQRSFRVYALDFSIVFVPTTTYLRLIYAYIHPAKGGSGCFKVRTNSPLRFILQQDEY